MELQRATITVSADNLTTALEAAKYLNKHFSTIYRWMKNGRLHPIRIAGQDYLDISEVESLKDGKTD